MPENDIMEQVTEQKVVESNAKLSFSPRAQLMAYSDGVAEKVNVYYMSTKDGILQIVGVIGDKLVILDAKVCEMGNVAKTKVCEMGNLTSEKAKQTYSTTRAHGVACAEQAWDTLKTKTVWIQDGHVYFTSAVEGKIVYFKAEVVGPVRSFALSTYASSKERMASALHKLRPYYVKLQGGYASIVGAIGERIVIIQTFASRTYTSAQLWTANSVDGARAIIRGHTEALLSKAVSLRNAAVAKCDQIWLSIEGGVVRVKGMVGARMLHLQKKISELTIVKRITAGWEAARKATSELTAKLLEIVSNVYGKARDALKVLQCRIQDGYMYVVCEIEKRFVVVRIKMSELYTATCTTVSDVCSGAKTTIIAAAEATKAKAIEARQSVRSLAANPDTRAAAAGAAAFGAGGAAAGATAGGVIGVACALPAALFTFGLSIPVGAAVGAGSGLCVGGSVGIVTGGAAGYKTHREKETISNALNSVFTKAMVCKDKALDSTSNLKMSVVARMGGTALA
jgi:hypothetical protein